MLLDATCNHKQAPITVTLGDDSVKKAAVDTIPKHRDASGESLKTKGKVSHEYLLKGCPTIIIVKIENQESPLILIPRIPLQKEFDKEGLEISFNYHLLKMRTPEGCEKGIPAEITEVSLN